TVTQTTFAVGTVTVNPQPLLSLNASATFVTVNTPVSLSAIGCTGTVRWSTTQTTPVISVTPANSTQTYSATCTTGPGCFTTATITINTTPPAGIVVSSATICYGSSATLTASGCANGTIAWSNGTTGATLSIASLTATTSYTATCSTPTGSVTSAVGTVTVNPKPVLSINASATFVTAGTPVSLSAIGCVGTIRWSTAQTTSVISVTPANTTQTYSATCTTGVNCFTTASITVNTLPPASITVSSATICYGSSATLTASGCANGTIVWSNGTTGATLSIASLTATTSYTATCSTPTGSVTSAVGTVTVNPKPVLSINASATFVTAGTPVSLSAIGCVGTIRWSTAQTTSVISVTPANTTQTYSATCTTGVNCFTTASITVNTLPPASITVSSATICYGSSATLTASGCANGTIVWSNGTTGATLSIASLTATTSYTATCSTPTGSATSAVGTVTVNPKPVLTLQASKTLVTASTPVSITATGCVGTIRWSTNQTTSVISVTPANTTQTYSATCTTGVNCFTTASITINTLPPASVTASSTAICYGSSATLVATGCSSGTIAWSNGTTGATLSIGSLTATTSYTAICSTPAGSTASAVGTVTVYPKPAISIQASNTFVTAGSPVSLSATGCAGNVAWSTNGAGNTITVMPMNSSQTYSATCTTGPGCFTTASITITTLPPANLTATSTTVCAGSSATLVALGCSNGTIAWSNGTTGATLSIASLTAT
ncbi:beta strand repeat-containing protein, partial [Arsenicibacter rosenii]|uniref:beta strand repeat-containing protein n=1 Tax=Arsenicibacter rosenii TaxID=1750698 RepID=UPI0035B634E9